MSFKWDYIYPFMSRKSRGYKLHSAIGEDANVGHIGLPEAYPPAI
jgi:hypothetical protein